MFTTSFPAGKHTSIKIEQSTRVDWPFWKMHVGDYIYVSTAQMRTRAMSASAHYKHTRGFQFKSKRMGSMYRIWRVA